MTRPVSARTTQAKSAARLAVAHPGQRILRLRGLAGALAGHVLAEFHPGQAGFRCRTASRVRRVRDDRASRWSCTCARSASSYRNDSGVPQRLAEATLRELELAKNVGSPRVHAKFRAGRRPARRRHRPWRAGTCGSGRLRVFERGVEGVADGAALTAAGGDRRAGLTGAHWKVLQSSTEPACIPCGTIAGVVRPSRA